MTLPIPVDYAPMEAKSVAKLPRGEGWQYEPKWDGFRCLAFRDGDEVALQSKSGQPLARYFPEITGAVRKTRSTRFVLDGEIVVPVDGQLSFDALLQRIHPAASRVQRLAQETPGCFIVFDLLVAPDGGDLTERPLLDRRAALEAFFARELEPLRGFDLSPCTDDVAVADKWLSGHAGTDGVVAKRQQERYCSGERAMQKIKRMRTADCVVGGFRYASKGKQIGSLLLGLYGDDGLLHHCGFTSSFTATERAEVTAKVEPMAGGKGFSGRAPGGPSRWANERSAEWIPVDPVLVCEVQYDHWSNERFRHGTKLLRWRPDKAPRACTFDQIRGQPV
jgi:ATP-dependent DNA ligase